MKKLIDEFKAFALRGNLIEIAVAFILGVAFNLLVQSFINDVVMQVVAAIFGEPDFTDLTFGLGDAEIYYGNFLTVLINFLLTALALFLIVKAVNKATRTKDEPPEVHECRYCKTNVPVTATRCPACTSELSAATA